MSGIAKAKGGRKNRKHGRNKLYCEMYKRTNRREANKLRRLNKYIINNANDLVAAACIDRLLKIVRS